MFIKLQHIHETPKAYKFYNGSWIPKSVLKSQGLNHPFYKIEDWFISKNYEKASENGDRISIDILQAIGGMEVKLRDLPKDCLEKWRKYWSGAGDSCSGVDYEPRMWGNDCFPGSMSDHF